MHKWNETMGEFQHFIEESRFTYAGRVLSSIPSPAGCHVTITSHGSQEKSFNCIDNLRGDLWSRRLGYPQFDYFFRKTIKKVLLGEGKES